jgi:hypothetical protein
MATDTGEKKYLALLIVGDVITLVLVTVIGFASHGTLGSAGTRMLTTFIPLAAAWFMVAPILGLYNLKLISEPRNLWRPLYAVLIAAPLAAWLRGIMLNSQILVLFVAVLGAFGALGVIVWRVVFYLIQSRTR